MQIMIEATPQEVAELVFELIDCDVEVDDDHDLDGAPLTDVEKRKLEILSNFADKLTQAINSI